VIIVSGGQPTEQFQSLPNQPTHVASLRPLDLNKWEVTDLGKPQKIIGIKITRTPECITIFLSKYIELILHKEGHDHCNPVSTPLDPNVQLVPNPDGEIGNHSNSFARLLGELQYVANMMRPDISYAVNRLALYTANPSLQHTTALKHVLRYLSGTRSLGIVYKADDEYPNFIGYTYASYANADERKSILGYMFIASGGAITWSSKKQVTKALSLTEAEYVAMSEAAQEVCWLVTCPRTCCERNVSCCEQLELLKAPGN